jgi:hypothetical protein
LHRNAYLCIAIYNHQNNNINVTFVLLNLELGMRRNLIILTLMVFVVLLFFGQSRAQCFPNDNGVCDTLYVEIWPGDEEAWPPWPNYARFPIRVTNDIPNPIIDSIVGLVIPLYFVTSNPSANVTIDPQYNRCGTSDLFPSPDLDRSIFRHLPDMATEDETNWMMKLSERMDGSEWDTRILDLSSPSVFILSLVATGLRDQRFPGGSRVLVATITFTLEDTATICIDTYLSSMMRMTFARSDAQTYIPQDLMPVCQYVGYPTWPPPVWFTTCPENEARSRNGTFVSSEFVVESAHGEIVEVSAQFTGSGIADVNVVYDSPPVGPYVTGTIQYTVEDHCQSGGTVTITAWDDVGLTGECEIEVMLSNHPPTVNLMDTWRALAGYNMTLHVSVSDMDGDAVDAIALDGFWYEPDSLQPPTNSPSFDGANPGLFTWVPEETEIGNWICIFSATDACGAESVHRMTISVGPLFCGDCNSDEIINLGDLVFLVSYLYRGGAPPDPLCKGDVNSDGSRDISDLVLLINYLFRGGLAPCFDCCEGSS